MSEINSMEWKREDLIGYGSFSSVNIAIPSRRFSPSCPEIMAVKSCNVSSSSVLENEVRVLEELGFCPEIIECFGHSQSVEKGKHLYNMFLEYAQRGSLASEMKKFGSQFQESQVKRFTRSILKGLCHIHAKGFAHCDIKLQNLLLFDRGDVKIADFGLARKTGEKQSEREQGRFEVRGTPLYMAPESINKNKYDSPCDVWALGCAVVEMISGKPPWNCKPETNVASLMIKIGASNDLPVVPDKLSEDGKDFLSKCFVRDPAKRWSADMLLNHPFIASIEDDHSCTVTLTRNEELPSLTPRSPFDFPEWASVQSSVPVSEFSTDNMEVNSWSDLINPTLRIKRIESNRHCDWSSSGSWITVR